MTVSATPRAAFWRCLYTPGHDAALIRPTAPGWRLDGTAVFRNAAGEPVCATYCVDIEDGWTVRRGRVSGFSGDRRFDHRMERTADGWMLDGVPNGLGDLVDLDFGFTPATNFQQVRRAGLQIGERREFSVAWFDLDQQGLSDLPQIYERRDELRYWYESPTVGYQAMLEMDRSGFVRLYPNLWQMEQASDA